MFLALSLLLAGFASTGAAPASPATSQGEWQAFELPLARPERWVLTLDWQGEQIAVQLQRSPIRSVAYEVLETGAQGELIAFDPPPPATYHGHVVGAPERGAAIAFVDGRIEGFVQAPGGTEIWIERRRGEGAVPHENLQWVHEDLSGGFDPANCRALPTPEGHAPLEPQSTGNLGLGAGCLRVADLAFDTDHEYFLINPTTAATVQHIEAILNAVNFGFARDVLIRHEISTLIVRSTEPDPYSTPGTSGLLDDFVNHWQTQQTGVVRDMAHLLTSRPLSDNIVGLAYLSVVCSPTWGYAWTWSTGNLSSETGIMGHELGHNWSAPHCLDTSGCFWMCGACNAFGPITAALIRNYAASRPCVVDGPGLPTPLPPTPLPDEEVGGDLVIDVLANDHDGNCDSLIVSAFDATSAVGGTVSISVGSGSNGGDELILAPLPGWEGIDTFSYTVMDGTSLTNAAEVTVVVQDDNVEISAHLRLDSSAVFNLLDSAPGASSGTFFGGPAGGQPGARPECLTAVLFDGIDDYGRLSGPRATDPTRMRFSLAAWVQPTGASGWQVIFGNPGSWSVGLDGTNPRLSTTTPFDSTSSVSLPTGQWSHIAVTSQAGGEVRFYVDGVLASTAAAGSYTGPAGADWFVGSANGEDSFFSGSLDDIQVYDGELTADQIAFLFANPARVTRTCKTPEVYCVGAPNSVSNQGAGIGYWGTQSVWAGDFTLFAHNIPANQFGIFYYGPNHAQVPFGDGFRCVGSGSVGIFRLPVVQADFLGDAFHTIDFQAAPANSGFGQLADGTEWSFQFWYRDAAGANFTFNLSNALRVSFCP